VTPRIALTMVFLSLQVAAAGDPAMLQASKQLCRAYWAGFGHENTNVCYHHRLNGAKGIETLSSPAEIARRETRGKPMPYGYGSGIQDVPLENGQLLLALCDAYEATHDAELAAFARRIFAGMKLVGTISPVPGFVPRGPHPDGKSYYPDSSRDQHCAFVEALWRYSRSELATAEDRSFIADELTHVAKRLEKNNWIITVEDDSKMAHVGFGWRQFTVVGAATLLGHLAAVHDATGDAHWAELYQRFSAEKGGKRWDLFRIDKDHKWRPETLYSNQFYTSLRVLLATEKAPARLELLRTYMRVRAERALRASLFDASVWRRLDWAGGESDEAAQKRLDVLGLRLDKPTTVLDAFTMFSADRMQERNWRRRSASAKLLYGMATVPFHQISLSGDDRLIAEIAPHVRRMSALMLAHGQTYTSGENFNRTVILALHLAAWQARKVSR